MTDSRSDQVWDKALQVSGEHESYELRQDHCGAWIRRADYGDKRSPFGWTIGYLLPLSRGGTEQLDNLRPIHLKNTLVRADGSTVVVVTSRGADNVIEGVHGGWMVFLP